MAYQPGASAWLSAIPSEGHDFILHKSNFQDALCLQDACSAAKVLCVCAMSLLSMPWVVLREDSCFVCHNHIRNSITHLLKEICHDVSVEPGLQLLTGENLYYCSAIKDDQARLDIAACGFWGNLTSTCLLWCGCFQSVCSFLPFIHLIILFLPYWATKEEGLWAKSAWCIDGLLFTSFFKSCWWLWAYCWFCT